MWRWGVSVANMSASSQPVVTPDDFSSIPSIISWFLAVTSVLFVTTKIVTKLSMTRSFALDDAAIITALVRQPRSTCCDMTDGTRPSASEWWSRFQCKGRMDWEEERARSAKKSWSRLKRYVAGKQIKFARSAWRSDRKQSVYATDFLYITTLFFSKSSVLVLLRALTPVRNHQILTYAVAGVLGLWAISGLFTVGFQCSTPQKWAIVTGECINQVRTPLL